MSKYELTMTFNYTIETDSIERTLEQFEFPSFPDIDMDTAVNFEGNSNVYEKVGDDE